jgi:circadian clock protein KaiC
MKRLPTAIPGLDAILEGGLFTGGVYMLEGPPGVGKTTLANQLAYSLARSGERTLYVTMLAESHARMLQHMEGQKFFDRRHVNADIFYISGYRELEDDGLKGVVNLLRSELARSKASFLVVDGLVVDRSSGQPDEGVRQFVHGVQSLVSMMSCTCLVLTSGTGNALSAEQTMVDGIFSFEDHGFHWRAERRMQVRKFRGSRVLRGQHTFCITEEGLQFFPRLESLPTAPDGASMAATPVKTGLPALDAVLQEGGVQSGSATLLIGHSGAGKTTVGLAFACASTLAQPGLLLTSAETAAELGLAAATLGLGMAEAVDSGALQVEPLGRDDESMDEMGHKILRLIDEFGVRRHGVDSVGGLADTLAFRERGYRFMGRLLAELKRRRVTSVFTIDPEALAMAAGTSLAQGVAGWFDNLFVFDKAPTQGRTLSIAKVRCGGTARASVDVLLGPSRHGHP